MKISQEELNRRLKEISTILATCQIIEESLKMYIDLSFTTIRRSLEDKVVFKFSRDDYENAPLERLITTFSKLSDNNNLIKALSGVKQIRNICAHKAMMIEMRNFVEENGGRWDQNTVNSIHTSLSACQALLMEDLKTLYNKTNS